MKANQKHKTSKRASAGLLLAVALCGLIGCSADSGGTSEATRTRTLYLQPATTVPVAETPDAACPVASPYQTNRMHISISQLEHYQQNGCLNVGAITVHEQISYEGDSSICPSRRPVRASRVMTKGDGQVVTMEYCSYKQGKTYTPPPTTAPPPPPPSVEPPDLTGATISGGIGGGSTEYNFHFPLDEYNDSYNTDAYNRDSYTDDTYSTTNNDNSTCYARGSFIGGGGKCEADTNPGTSYS